MKAANEAAVFVQRKSLCSYSSQVVELNRTDLRLSSYGRFLVEIDICLNQSFVVDDFGYIIITSVSI